MSSQPAETLAAVEAQRFFAAVMVHQICEAILAGGLGPATVRLYDDVLHVAQTDPAPVAALLVAAVVQLAESDVTRSQL